MSAHHSEPPPPRGAGAGGGGRASAPAPKVKIGQGWSPTEVTRQKDRALTKLRVRRLRKEMTSSEKLLAKLLRSVEGAHFRRQVAVDEYVFDFGWYARRVLIELDGSIHRLADVQLNDKAKALHAVTAGFRVLRFKNDDVWIRPQWVLDRVREALNAGAFHRPPPLTPPRKGAGDE